MKSNSSQPVKTVGPLVKVDFPEFGLNDVAAKIDTGAFNGALHCTKINKRALRDGEVLKFSPFDHPDLVISTRDFFERKVKSSNGQEQIRYFITAVINLHGLQYPIVLSLADRSEMKLPVLIGRRFLKKNNFLVDVSRTS